MFWSTNSMNVSENCVFLAQKCQDLVDPGFNNFVWDGTFLNIYWYGKFEGQKCTHNMFGKISVNLLLTMNCNDILKNSMESLSSKFISTSSCDKNLNWTLFVLLFNQDSMQMRQNINKTVFITRTELYPAAFQSGWLDVRKQVMDHRSLQCTVHQHQHNFGYFQRWWIWF